MALTIPAKTISLKDIQAYHTNRVFNNKSASSLTSTSLDMFNMGEISSQLSQPRRVHQGGEQQHCCTQTSFTPCGDQSRHSTQVILIEDNCCDEGESGGCVGISEPIDAPESHLTSPVASSCITGSEVVSPP